MIGPGARWTMRPRSRTRTGTRARARATTRTGTRPALRPGSPLDALADQAPAQHPVQGPGHFLGQVRTAASNRRTGPTRLPARCPGGARLGPARLGQARIGQARIGQARIAGTLRRYDRPAVPALDLTQPLDQMHAGTPRAAVHLGHPVRCVLAPGADENLALAPHPALPRTLPAAGVGLPHTTSIAGHSRLLRSSPVAWLTGPTREPRQLRSASTFLYSAMSRAWGMGFTTFHRMTPALSMMNVPRVATPLSSSNTP
jgi:hypothetical protein